MISELAQIYRAHPNLIGLWKREFLFNAEKVFDTGRSEIEDIKKLKQENNELLHQIGKLTVDINWLKKAVMMPIPMRKAMIIKVKET
ncbi:MAG: hypothetical protein IPM52_04475 [Bacteroidetes bacterium]|nr:hypothetical protein [Bacteroidota bacterium]